ncbi:hypothetical protein Tco_1413203 [Tanacetum coccineum]
MGMMNVTFDELSHMDFEQRSSKPELQGRTSGHISSRLNLTYASSTITPNKSTEHATRTALAAPEYLNRQTPNAYTTTAETAPTPKNSSIEAPATPNTSQEVDELQQKQQQHFQQQPEQSQIQSEEIVDNANNALVDDNTFINPFATPSTSSAESSL